MAVADAIRRRMRARRRRRAGRDVFEALDEARRTAARLDLAFQDKLVIFSDHHKGARDGADDFQRCERAYNAALVYYRFLGWHLVELGDVEELWENSLAEVVGSYPETLRLAADFHRDGGRYTRLYGNHDLAWRDSELFAASLGEYGYAGVTPRGALLVAIEGRDGRPLGEALLVHGHQGSADSDRHARLSEFFVRRGWRPLQRFINRPWTTPSVDWELRGEHASTMAAWAQDRRQLVIAGHTHLPVFFNQRKTADPPPDVMSPEPSDPQMAEALRLARAAWADAEAVRLARQRPASLTTPCYFNTGCCSFGDGDITGIEISDGEIRLVRWPADPDTDRRQLGTPLQLAEVFEQVASTAASI